MGDKIRICKYKLCVHYDSKAKTYCCMACSADAYDYHRLKKESQKRKRKSVMNKLIVEYDPDNGLAFSDNNSKKYVESTIKSFISSYTGKKSNPIVLTVKVIIGTTLLIDLFRCAVAEGEIEHTKIKFLFKEETFDIDKCGRCKTWPKGFGDFEINVLEKLLECADKERELLKHVIKTRES